MTLLVFGKSGQVATELRKNANVEALGRDAADLENPDRCAAIIRSSNAHAVINAAAYTAVDAAEAEEEVATIVNGEAPAAMAQAAAEKGIPFLHVSTDYVFDGSGEAPWQPDDRVAPLNAYGRSKLVGEKGVLDAGGNHAILRTSWVFSSHGANFVKSMLRLSKTRNELSIVADQIGGPTAAADIANALLVMANAMIGGQTGGLYHFAGTPVVSWKDFAKEIFAQSNRSVSVNPIPTVEFPTPASRPHNSRMDCSRITDEFGIDVPDWRKSLAVVLEELKLSSPELF